ncbi:MAG: hypothetical protein JWP54_2642 [Cryobacterium sp.]|nr:hypothetical protein [Cryobacterium sp.]
MECVAVAQRRVEKANESGLSFDQSSNGRTLIATGNEITLPVARLRSIFRRKWALVNGQHGLLESWTVALSTLVSAPVVASGP